MFNLKKSKKTKYHQGKFFPKNKEKFVGSNDFCTYRSSWELSVMNFFDDNPYILNWSSELIKINYMDPITKKWRTYYPDFIIKYKKNNIEYTELVEVKPRCQAYQQYAKSKKDKEAFILNTAKWKYALKWCEKNNAKFRILTEKDIYL
ncbi:MAG: head completion protein [Caudoviricetes sp.]|nr:MAG: head completion protein [Caudoviricetes sp.]